MLVILFLTLINTFFELVGIGLIIPILGYFVGEEPNNYFQTFSYFQNKSETELLLIVIVLFNLIYLMKFFSSTLLVIKKNKFDWYLFAELSKKVFSNYLNKKYLSHITSNLSEQIQVVRSEANLFSFAIVRPLIDLTIESILFLSINIFLLVYNFKISLIVILFYFIMSVFWNKYYNNYLSIIGKKRQFHSIGAIKEIQNSFGNFKETIIYGLKTIFLDRFQIHNVNTSNVGYKRDTITALPRLFLELISVTGILIIFIVLIKQSLSLPEILILLGVFIFAIVRMLPSLTKIIRAIQTIKFNNVVVEKIYKELKSFHENHKVNKSNLSKLDFKILKLKNISFNYPGSEKMILKNVNFEISNGKKLGIVGKTGSGKTTLINIICGLIKTTKGEVTLNETDLESNLDIWQSKIGYVAHDVFLLDESIEYNISFKDKENSDREKIIKLLKKVDLFDFVEQLPDKIDTLVGEKGGKLSRGQCQRLGIARALYKNPEILIFDEATSAIDTATESKIFKNLYLNNTGKTIISIAHRTSSLSYCDKIYQIKDNSIFEVINK